MDGPREARLLGLDEAIGRLRSPFALEEFSSLTGTALFVVDLGAIGAEPSAADLAAAEQTLARLPCPTVAIEAERVPPRLARLRDRVDVVLAAEVDLAPIAETVRRCPLAAMGLVQLLRLGEGRDVHEGLVAESLLYSVLQSGPEFGRWLAGRRREAGRPSPLRRATSLEEPPVLVERFRGVLSVTLNRPGKHNAFDAAMRDALAEALAPALADPGLERVELSGRGASFCSGGDLDEFGTLPDPATAHAIRSTRNVARTIHALGERCAFHVHGACIGAGVELPAFSPAVSAHEDAFFELPELRFGLVPGAGGTVSLPRRIGRQRTAWLALSGRRIDATTAQAWGLVDELRMSRVGDGERRAR